MANPETNAASPLTRDLLASIVVFLVALPLCMGIAIASGLPPAAGLITGIIGGMIVGMVSGSPLQVSGPAAGLTVIVFGLVQKYGVETLGLVVMVAGLIQLCAGFLGIGRWFRAMSPAVVYGMLSGIGVLIMASQFHVMLDGKPKANGLQNLLAIPGEIFGGIFPLDGSRHEHAALIGILTISILVLWQKFRPQKLRFLPGALVAVVTATAVASQLSMPVARINIPSHLWEGLHWPTAAVWAKLGDLHILAEALALAFVASAETLLSAAAVDKLHNGVRTNYDRELSAQGLGNLLCGLAGSLPMTGVIVRSSANVLAGAATRRSAVFHGVWLAALVMLAPGVLRIVPVSCLAGILVYTGFKLIEWQHVKKLVPYGPFPLVIYGATVLMVVATDLLTGVLVGLGLSFLKLVYKATHLEVTFQNAADSKRTNVYLNGTASFVRLPRISEVLENIEPGRTVHLYVDHLYYIDHTCLDAIHGWVENYRKRGGEVEVDWPDLQRHYDIARIVRETAQPEHAAA